MCEIRVGIQHVLILKKSVNFCVKTEAPEAVIFVTIFSHVLINWCISVSLFLILRYIADDNIWIADNILKNQNLK